MNHLTQHVQLTREQLINHAIKRQEGRLDNKGALVVLTGERTGRSPKDKFIVKDSYTEHLVNWGTVNQPISPKSFEQLWHKAQQHLATKSEYFVSNFQIGASEKFCVRTQVTTEDAWQQLFVKNLFIDTPLPFNPEKDWQMLCLPSLQTSPAEDGVNSNATLIIHFSQKKVLLCGLRYAGEMKKAMFSVMNFLMPEHDVLPMHCAANAGEDGSVSLFFGLSGTGKTTLSADPDRLLIGDDEHGWSAEGVFNFEGGCYAKCINLSEKYEPVIFNAIRSGAILENVVLDDHGNPDYTDTRYTENTRCAYPRSHIEKCLPANEAGHPNAVVFLTCDLYGVFPPVAKLTKEQAAYYFLSGYTALVGSTEVGQGKGISTTFSACFGAPFFPRGAQVYADLLIKRLNQTGAQAYLVNTGWTGGAYGKGGERLSIPVTRTIIKAITNGLLANTEWVSLPKLGLEIPTNIEGIDKTLLDPRTANKNQASYEENLAELITKFQENFKKFSVAENIQAAGPK